MRLPLATDRPPLSVDIVPQFLHPVMSKDRHVLFVVIDCLRRKAEMSKAEDKILLLILEDIQWIDAVSQDLLELVTHACVDLPLLVVVTYRPLGQEETV